MKEYIEREKICLTNFEILLCNHDYKEALKMLLDKIENIPAADVRHVVLCKDCQNSYEWANVDGDNYRYCGYLRSIWDHYTDRMVDDDDFCKWGIESK